MKLERKLRAGNLKSFVIKSSVLGELSEFLWGFLTIPVQSFAPSDKPGVTMLAVKGIPFPGLPEPQEPENGANPPSPCGKSGQGPQALPL